MTKGESPGPDEPPDRAAHAGVFGSHYDEGRITRILDSDRIWALLAQRSMARYRDLERQSGIAYYHEVEAQQLYEAIPTGGPHPDVPAALATVAQEFPLVILRNRLSWVT